MFTYTTTVKLHETDAAGTIFFGHLFRMAHDAYEEFLNSERLGIGELLKHGEYARFIVHAEADFKKPISVGDDLEVKLTAENIGDSSYTIRYDFQHNGETACSAKTVHVCVDRITNLPIPIPQELKEKLLNIV